MDLIVDNDGPRECPSILIELEHDVLKQIGRQLRLGHIQRILQELVGEANVNLQKMRNMDFRFHERLIRIHDASVMLR